MSIGVNRMLNISCVSTSCAVFVCIPTDFCACGSFCINFNKCVLVVESRDNFLSDCCIVTSWAVLTFCKTCICTIGSYCFINNYIVSIGVNGKFNLSCVSTSCTVFVCIPTDFCASGSLCIYLDKCIFMIESGNDFLSFVVVASVAFKAICIAVFCASRSKPFFIITIMKNISKTFITCVTCVDC